MARTTMTTASAARLSFVSDTNFVQQYVIVTNNFGPEYGRNAGSVVNIITKAWNQCLARLSVWN